MHMQRLAAHQKPRARRGEVVMPAKRIAIPAEKIAEGRFLYEQTLMPLEDVAGTMGISRATLSSRINEWGWHKRNYDLRKRPAHSQHAAPPGEAQIFTPGYPRAGTDRVALIERLQQSVGKQLDVVDAIASSGQTRGEAERTVRMFASLSRTLREMTLLDSPPAPPGPEDDIPRDVDELRRELSRKLAALVAGRAGAVPSGT
jgi:hypothetical protein